MLGKSSARRTRVLSALAAVCLIGGTLALGASTASAMGPLTLTPASGEIAPGGSLNVVVKNTNTKNSTSALKSSVTLSPANAPFQVTNRCLGVALGKGKTCTVTIAYTGASAPTDDQTATLMVSSKKPGVVATVTGVYTVKGAPTGCAKNTAAGSIPSDNLQNVMNAATDGDTIEITGTCTGNFTIGSDLTLAGVEGTSPTLDGNGSGTVLRTSFGVGAVVIVNDLTITGGSLGLGNATGNTLTLNDSTVSENVGSGGVDNNGTLTVNDSYILDNDATPFSGGGLNVAGTVTLNNTTVSGNTAGDNGGGIYAISATLTLNDSTLSGNSADCHGGAMINYATTTLNNSTVSDNTAGCSGGGISNIDDGSFAGTLTLNDTDVTGNSSPFGGGIYSQGGAPLTLEDSTVSGNTSTGPGGGIGVETGMVFLRGASSVTGNTAAGAGGGIYLHPGLVRDCDANGVADWTGAISPNTPDDPPTPFPITCT